MGGQNIAVCLIRRMLDRREIVHLIIRRDNDHAAGMLAGGAAAYGFNKAFLRPASEMENYILRLNAINHGDTSRTEDVRKWAVQNAKETTWGLAGVMQEYASSRGFGMSDKEARNFITMLQDQGGYHGWSLADAQGASLQLKQMYSRGAIQAADASILTGYGINVYQLLAEKLKVDQKVLRDLGGKGKLGPDSIRLLFQVMAEQAKGVERIGILRADVDNLGTTFVYGLQRPDGDDKYVTLSRTSTLSRQLSLFFKCYINEILRKGTADNFGGSGERKAVIVYSGGDDVFLAGAWNDVIAAFMDIRNALEKFTQGTLTISGGVGIYDAKYPLNVMAKEVERLEDRSKHVEGKNAVTLFDETHAYPWNVFIQNVVTEKLGVLKTYFDQNDEHGMAFLYHLMELLRESGNDINFARYVYLLSRMEPQEHENKEKRAAYRSFSKKMYEWSGKEQDRKELIMAIYLYVYLNRKREEQD